MEDSPWVRYDGKLSAGEAQKLPYTKHVSLLNLELPKQFLKWGPKKECHPSFWGQEKKSSNLEEIISTLRSFWINNQTLHPREESQFYRISLASRFAPSGAISSTDSHLPCVCQSLNFLKLGMVIGYPTFNIFNHQNSTNPEVYCSSTPFWKSIIPFPNNPWNESVFKLHGFWISFAEFHAFSIFSACIGCTSTKGIVFCWIPGVQNEGLGGHREMVIPTSPNTLGPGWLKDDEQILPNDTSSFPEVSDRKTTIQKKVFSLYRWQKHHRQFIFSNLVGRMIWLLGIG